MDDKRIDFFAFVVLLFLVGGITFTSYLGDTNNGIDDDGDWDVRKHDKNGNKRADKGEPNVDEDDEARIQRKPVSLFPIIPTIGITWNF